MQPLTRHRRSRHGALALVLAVVLVGAMSAAAKPMSRYEQRQAYREALDDITTGRQESFRRLRQELDSYVLAPYLDYYDVQARLASVSDQEMAAFQAGHAELPATRILYWRWLRHLGARGQWQRLLDHYEETSDAELRCYQMRALLHAGERERAMAGAGELWTVPYSQPNACDPLFEDWMAAGLLTEGRAWERLQLALDDNQRQLARYLLRFFDGPLEPWAKALYDVHNEPQALTRPGNYRQDNQYSRAVIAHGLSRLAAKNPDAAMTTWQRYQDSHRFPPEDVRALTELTWLAEARQGRFPALPDGVYTTQFASAMAEATLKAQRWDDLVYWIDNLPEAEREDLRWQYWLARAQAQTRIGAEHAQQTYGVLAEQRNYYGFLAAQRLGRPARLNPAPPRDDPAALVRLAARPEVARALELYAVGDTINARREWHALLPELDPEQLYDAARLAQQAGWLAQGIVIASAAPLRDSLELRFPRAYPLEFQRLSNATTVPQPFLLAVARQESAFDPQARSHANARGLMQLMHPTATIVAHRIGQTAPSTGDLYDPTVNIELGSHHLARLLDRYQDRRPLAAAAYNAGENRVDRWVKDGHGLDMDVWIEKIPFRETRNYVKNVLAFTQVYAQLTGVPIPMLTAREASVN